MNPIHSYVNNDHLQHISVNPTLNPLGFKFWRFDMFNTENTNTGWKTRHLVAAVSLGLIFGIGVQALAAMKGPAEHKGVSVTALGEVSEASLQAQIGLEGYILRLRSVTVEAGGQIKEHSHADRPGLVKVISGTWIEGRPDGEGEFPANLDSSILEDRDTIHWVYNRSDEPATALVCDIAKSE
jgi:quercetin dioxygenase-like cupin family protein